MYPSTPSPHTNALFLVIVKAESQVICIQFLQRCTFCLQVIMPSAMVHVCFTSGDIIGIIFGLFGAVISIVPFVIYCCRGEINKKKLF